MLDLEQIVSYYPEHLRPFKKNILREYIQYKLLEALFASEYGKLDDLKLKIIFLVALISFGIL